MSFHEAPAAPEVQAPEEADVQSPQHITAQNYNPASGVQDPQQNNAVQEPQASDGQDMQPVEAQVSDPRQTSQHNEVMDPATAVFYPLPRS